MEFFKKIKIAISYRKAAAVSLLTPLEMAVNFLRFIASKFFNGIKRFIKIVTKHSLSLTGLTALLMIGSTNFANAGWFNDATAGAIVSWFGSSIAYVIGLVAGSLFWVVGLLVRLSLNLNLHITEPGNLIVQSGWNIILNITNLGFVLAIIVIAFATVINYESYAIKKTIWKLIVAALLVNFSFVIAGAIVDVANNATQFMMEKSGTNDPTVWASAMAGMFQPQQFLSVDKNFDPTGQRLQGVTDSSLNTFFTIIASLIFGAIFTFIAAITLFTVGILLFIRYITLSFLLMFSPIIWLARVFPFTAKYWSMWWQRFLKWTLFAPIMMFFMYLALRTMSGTMAAYGSVPADFKTQSPITTPLAAIGQLFLVIGIIMGGMYVANLMGIEGAKMIHDTASKFGKGYAYRGGQRVMNFKVPFMKDKEGKEIRPIQRLTNKLSATPGLKWAGKGLNYLGANAEKGAAGAMSDYRSRIKDFNKDRFENEIMSSGRIISGRERNVALEEAAKNKKLKSDGKVVNELLMDPDKLGSLEKQFKSQNLNFADITKAIGANAKILKSAKEGDSDELLKEQIKFFEKASPDDIAKSTLAAELYKEKPSFKESLGDETITALRGSFTDALIGAGRFGSVNKIFSNLSQSEDIERFKKQINSSIKKLEDSGINEKIEQANNLKKSLKKALGKRFYEDTEEDKNEDKKPEEKPAEPKAEKK